MITDLATCALGFALIARDERVTNCSSEKQAGVRAGWFQVTIYCFYFCSVRCVMCTAQRGTLPGNFNWCPTRCWHYKWCS